MATVMESRQQKQGEDVSHVMARNVVCTRYEDVPQSALEVAKKNIIDTLACILVGSQDVVSRWVVELMVEQGGREEAVIPGFRHLAPAASVAMASGTLARSFDYDDCHEGSSAHLSVSTVPVVLAMAERQGSLSGREALTTVALANDMIGRLALAGGTGAGPGDGLWATSMLYGVFGSTAAAGRVLGLNEVQMIDALGIALTRAAGSHQYGFENGAYQFNFGWHCQVGILAALMARKGITFARQVFQGKLGLYNMFKRGSYMPEILTDDLGVRFEGANVSIKPYPTCKHTHTTISAILESVAKFGLTEEDIEDILVLGNAGLVSQGRDPSNIRFDPNNRYEAKQGLQKLVAMAVVKGNVTMDDTLGKTLDDQVLFPRIARLARRVRLELDPELTKHYTAGAVSPSILHITTRDGRQLHHRVDFVKGHPQTPMSLDDCLDKFRSSAPYADKPLSEEQVERAVELMVGLENLENVNELMALFH